MSALIEQVAYEIPWQTDEVRYYTVRLSEGVYKVQLLDENNQKVIISNYDAFIAAFVGETLEAYIFKFTLEEGGEALADLTVKYQSVPSLKEV